MGSALLLPGRAPQGGRRCSQLCLFLPEKSLQPSIKTAQLFAAAKMPHVYGALQLPSNFHLLVELFPPPPFQSLPW